MVFKVEGDKVPEIEPEAEVLLLTLLVIAGGTV
jgi:hypothetical protein